MVKTFLSKSRYLIIIAVAGSFAAATALLAYAAIALALLLAHFFGPLEFTAKGAKALALGAIEIVDLFLLATVFYIIAMGLYELFIDDQLDLPAWLEIHNLDDLKNKLVGVVVVVLAVLFLGQVVAWDGQRDLLGYGAAIAMMIASLTWFLSHKSKKGGEAKG